MVAARRGASMPLASTTASALRAPLSRSTPLTRPSRTFSRTTRVLVCASTPMRSSQMRQQRAGELAAIAGRILRRIDAAGEGIAVAAERRIERQAARVVQDLQLEAMRALDLRQMAGARPAIAGRDRG